MPSNPISVLAVDDEPAFCALTKEFLKMPGEMEVDTASSVKEAMTKLATKRYHAVVSDYQMPGEDGIQFLKSLRAAGDMTPFILFTGKGREEVVIEALNNGADSYLQKGGEPVSQYAELGHRIRMLVRRHQAEGDLRASKEMLSLITDNMRDGVWLLDMQLRPTWMSPSVFQISGFTIDELANIPIDRQMTPRSFQKVMSAARTIMTPDDLNDPTKELSFADELEFYRKDGSTLLIDTVFSIVRDEQGRPTGVLGVGRDITQGRQAEAALRESEARYDKLVEQSHTVTWEVDMDGLFTFVSHVSEAVWGYRPDELVGKKHFYDLTPEAEPESHNGMVSETLKIGERSVGLENPIKTKDGQVIWVFTNAIPLLNADGTLRGYQGSGTDITERKRATQAMEQTMAAMENSIDGIAILDGDGRYVFLNQAHAMIYGYDSTEELMGKSWRTLYDEKELDRFDRCLMPLLGKNGSWRGEGVGLRRDGSKFIQEVSLTKLEEGGLICIVRDTSEMARDKEALRQKTALFEAQVAASLDGILVIDENLKRILVNQRIVELYQVPQHIMDDEDDNLLLKHVVGLTRYPQQFLEKVTYLNDHIKETSRDEIEFKNGMVLDRYSAPVLGKNGEYYGRTWTFHDVTERKRTERAINEANRKLNLLSSITRHDIKNQLLVLEGNLALLEQKQLDHASVEHLLKAETAAGRISAMIQFTKTYEDIGVHAPIWQDVRTLVGSGVRDILLGSVEVVNDVPVGMEVFADPLITKVFHNLIQNSLRHGYNVTTIRFTIEERDGVRAIVCEDDGVGISAGMKESIFTNGSGKDHGHGLFLSREILSITGIKIGEEGTQGQGARFIITVPPGGIRTEKGPDN